MLDVRVPAAVVRRPRPRAAVSAHTSGGDCVRFHPDSFSFLNFNHAAIGSRAASRLSLTLVAGLIYPHRISPKPNGQPAGPPFPANDWPIRTAWFRTAQLIAIYQPDECEVIGCINSIVNICAASVSGAILCFTRTNAAKADWPDAAAGKSIVARVTWPACSYSR